MPVGPRRGLNRVDLARVGARAWVAILAAGTLAAGTAARAEDASPAGRESAILLSPLVGAVRNRVEREGPPGTPPTVLTDTGPEYGLYAMYASRRLVVNDTLFNARVNDSTVWGNVASLNVYGDPAARLTWYLGGSHLWHTIVGDRVDVDIDEPLLKAGVMLRVPAWHLSVNPYAGYAWQRVKTTVEAPGMGLEETDHNGCVLYGVSVYWRWRMLYANAKYYLEDSRDSDERNSVCRLWASAMFTARAGILTRLEYAEQLSTTDRSVLVGPVILF